MPTFFKINIRGDLVASLVTFAGIAVMRLGSSLVLTRILRPEAYGVIAILTSVSFTVSMLSDIGTFASIVRAPNGDSPTYLNTVWTIRLGRAVFNTGVMYFATPWVVQFFGAPELATPLRVFSLWFLIDGMESNAFPLAARHRRTRIVVYSDFGANAVSSIFTIVYCYYSGTYWGMVYGLLLNRVIYVACSHLFYLEARPRLCFDRAAAKEILQFTRFVMPSSVLTLTLSQFDKYIFLRFFDLTLLGIYGVANNISGQTEALISKTSEMVIYPRCAHNFRENRQSFGLKYYTENLRVFAVTGGIVAAVAGAAQLLISVMYDPRYAQAGIILQALMIRSALACFGSPAEQLLIAAGGSRVILAGNIVRAVAMLAGSVLGYYLFGFVGFIYGLALSSLPPVLYYFWRQYNLGALFLKYEFFRAVYMVCVAIVVFLCCKEAMNIFRLSQIRL